MGFFPQTSSFSFFFSLKKDQKKRRSQKRRGVQPFFFVWNFALSSVVSSDFCLKIKKKSPHEPNYEATWLRAHSPPQRPTALSLPSPFALWPLFCPTKKKYIYIQRETYDDASRHVSIHHRAHRGTPGHETAVEEPQKRVFGYRSRARVYRDG